MAGKLKFIVSDLHIGAGLLNQKPHPGHIASTSNDEAFARFLQDITEESQKDKRQVEVILNGDIFEFLQIPAVPVNQYEIHHTYPLESYTNSSPEASIQRLDILIKHHPRLFAALTDFMHVENPRRRLTIIKGNHDVNLYWPQVKHRLRTAIGATGVRASMLLFAEEFINREGIYVEHGHQRAESLNRYPDFLAPLDPQDASLLHYPPISHLLIHYFNQMENGPWWLQSLSPPTDLIWYALRWDFELACALIQGFLEHIPQPLPPQRILLKQLKTPALHQKLALSYQNEAQTRRRLHEEIQEMMRRAIDRGLPIIPPLLTPISDDPIAVAQAQRDHIHAALQHSAQALVDRGTAKIIVLGHTHTPEIQVLENDGLYLNSGSWLCDNPLLNIDQTGWDKLFTTPPNDSGFKHTLPYVRVEYDSQNQPHARLLDYAGQGLGHFFKNSLGVERFLSPLRNFFGGQEG